MMAAAPSKIVAPTPAQEKKICKRQPETGSLVKMRKVCHTAREWNVLRQNARRDTEDLQGAQNAKN